MIHLVCQVGDASSVTADKERQIERMGLTPDWIIQATCFKVFQLKPPTPQQPFIKGLLDPCSNSLLAPNIPAEKLYDKEVRSPDASLQALGTAQARQAYLQAFSWSCCAAAAFCIMPSICKSQLSLHATFTSCMH